MPLCVGAQDNKLVSGFVAQRVFEFDRHLLEILPSFPIVVRRTADDIVYCRVVLWKLLKSCGGCFALTLKA